MAEKWHHFDSMVWPVPDLEVAWRVYHAPESITEKDKYYLASVLSAFSKWGHGLPHDSGCVRFEIGSCWCSVHQAMRAVDEKYREMVAAIDAVYDEEVKS